MEDEEDLCEERKRREKRDTVQQEERDMMERASKS